MKTIFGFILLSAVVVLAACGSVGGVGVNANSGSGFGQLGVTVNAPQMIQKKHADGHGGFTTDITIPGGESLDSVSWTLTNGTNTYTGTADITTTAAMATWIIGSVAPGGAYTIAISGTTSDGLVTCSNRFFPAGDTVGPVNADQATDVSVNLNCAGSQVEAGAVGVSVDATSCPVLNYLVAPATASVGVPTPAAASAVAPGNLGIVYTWSVTAGGCTLSGQAEPDTDDSDVTVTDTTAEACTIQVTVDNPAGTGNIDCQSPLNDPSIKALEVLTTTVTFQ